MKISEASDIYLHKPKKIIKNNKEIKIQELSGISNFQNKLKIGKAL